MQSRSQKREGRNVHRAKVCLDPPHLYARKPIDKTSKYDQLNVMCKSGCVLKNESANKKRLPGKRSAGRAAKLRG